MKTSSISVPVGWKRGRGKGDKALSFRTKKGGKRGTSLLPRSPEKERKEKEGAELSHLIDPRGGRGKRREGREALDVRTVSHPGRKKREWGEMSRLID